VEYPLRPESQSVDAESSFEDMMLLLEGDQGLERENVLEQLIDYCGDRVFQYKTYSGTVADMYASCPAFSVTVEQGFDYAIAWLNEKDGQIEPQTLSADTTAEKSAESTEPSNPDDQSNDLQQEPDGASEHTIDTANDSISNATATKDAEQSSSERTDSGDIHQSAKASVEQVSMNTPQRSDNTASKKATAPGIIQPAEKPSSEKVTSTHEDVPSAIVAPAIELPVEPETGNEKSNLDKSKAIEITPPIVTGEIEPAQPTVPLAQEVATDELEMDANYLVDSTNTIEQVTPVEAENIAEYKHELEPEHSSYIEPLIAASDAESEATSSVSFEEEVDTNDFKLSQPIEQSDEPEGTMTIEENIVEATGEDTEQLGVEIQSVEVPLAVDSEAAVPFVALEQHILFEDLPELAGVLGLDDIDTMPLHERSVIAEQAEAVISAVAVLESARTEQQCREALKTVQAKLAEILQALGCADYERLAAQLLHSYDIHVLQRYLLQLIQYLRLQKNDVSSILSRQVTMLQTNRRIGMHAVNAAVSLAGRLPDLMA
jgi:hypothetical protein